MRREKSIDLSILFDYKYRILRAKMIENVYKNMWNNNIAITISFNDAVRYKKLDKCTLSHTRRKRSWSEGISYKRVLAICAINDYHKSISIVVPEL